MELVFSTAALTVLIFALVAGKVLVTQQCFGYSWAVQAQHQPRLSAFPPPCIG